MSISRAASRFIASAVLVGALAGITLVTAISLGTPRSQPMLVYLVYGTLVVGTEIMLRRAGSRFRRFTLGLSAFMLTTLVVYIYVGAVVNPRALRMPLWEHAWRLGFMLGLGTLATAIPLAFGTLIGASRGGPRASSKQRDQHSVKPVGSDASALESHMESAMAVVR